ncbi:CPBP family intramembrane glutamic endopeptidase [Desmospora profundinema]|uniref:Membrane protease YdiL (CAAX protease family) n=1 Tax=Desmospora profundinema TaxID=1571184 RepID=A0ABU1IL45_9BACL|nr:type II CAAX endopeptidase family protein [Desmospora profundinema]MDR6225493.1 membrane protease YdiL (CAAX protease family) [Desmospora profundinema]
MVEIIFVVLMFAPIILLMLFANLTQQARVQSGEPNAGQGWSITAHVILAISFALMLMGGVLLMLLGLLAGSAQPGEMPGISEEEARMAMGILENAVLIGLSLAVPALGGFLLQIPAIRRLLTKPLPLDADNPVHTFALIASMFIWVNFFFTLSVGLETLANTEGLEQATSIPTLWAQQLTFFALALIGVGWLTRRDWRQAFQRLGLERPTGRQWGMGILAGFGLVLFAHGASYLGEWLGFPIDPTVDQLTEQLLAPLFGSVLGILTLGLSAALGEEALFRGALQPRFGLLLTTVLFTVVHSNYGLSLSTLVVFFVGLALGLIRIRHNTTTAMIVHAVYNMSLGVLVYLGG